MQLCFAAQIYKSKKRQPRPKCFAGFIVRRPSFFGFLSPRTVDTTALENSCKVVAKITQGICITRASNVFIKNILSKIYFLTMLIIIITNFLLTVYKNKLNYALRVICSVSVSAYRYYISKILRLRLYKRYKKVFVSCQNFS